MPGAFRKVVITGGSGFLGSHLCDRLLAEGAEVVCVDNFLTGRKDNVQHLLADRSFSLVDADVSERLEVEGPVDAVLHFASPASPPDYLQFPIETMKVGGYGTHNALELARAKGARFLLASTSEVYGDPLVNPQPETYWGNVNPVGPRSVYDEAKRFAEALALAYHRAHGVDVRIVRIFNTMGERMRPDDGRAVPNFITQALRGEPLTVHGDGTQTRSVAYVSDVVEGIWRLLASQVVDPVNIGNPDEHTVLELAHAVASAVGIEPDIRFVDRPIDDPSVRRPDITRARELLGWEPKVELREGLQRTVAWFRRVLV
jgi:dTDP-glucose 4,6-dehydratase